ncbi:glycosyltransferase family 2 protein [Alloyangia pacifica]|uniref:glycosyltransferase family 2 protein n=1 Tax=Alloyangia pacifica TaxID=311180 RepID=UPI001CFF0721|nr:glycosyltransferase family 2 protein [Alloyangia pacifica]
MQDTPPRPRTRRRAGGLPDLGRPVSALLMEDGALDAVRALEALARSRHDRSPLSRLLQAEGTVTPEQLRDALARSHGVPALSRQTAPPSPALAELLPPDVCLRHGALPWMRRDDGLVLAMAHPEGFAQVRALLPESETRVVLALANEADIVAEVTDRHAAEMALRAETALPSDLSCRDMNRLTPARAAVLAGAGSTLLALLFAAPGVFFASALGLAAATMVISQLAKLSAFVAGLKPLPPGPPEPAGGRPETPTVSLIVPLHREESIAATLVDRLDRLDYPRAALEVLLALEAEDRITRATLEATALPPWMRIVEVPPGGVTTKPRALNYALNFARGTLIGIYDAEDSPAPDQLRRLAAHFSRAPPEAGCVQGILDFYNPRANWLARCFTIEYASWFRILLPGFARLGFAIPLGGTTVFFRREALNRVGGWDAHNVTEDADLGVRLARFGYRTDLLPLVTREEANCRLWPWIRQRSRWLKGYLITWRVHMRHPLRCLRDLGPWRMLGLQLVFLGALMPLLLAPLLWGFWLFQLGASYPILGPNTPALLPGLTLLLLGSEAVMLIVGLGGVLRSPHPRLLLTVSTLFLYFPLATIALYKALWEMLHRPFYWDKTSHGHSAPDQAGADVAGEGP